MNSMSPTCAQGSTDACTPRMTVNMGAETEGIDHQLPKIAAITKASA
jgi:hypothetical protein